SRPSPPRWRAAQAHLVDRRLAAPPEAPSTSYFPAMTVGVSLAMCSPLGTGEADLPQQGEEVVQLGVDERLAAREERCRDATLRIGPADDVGEAEVSERFARVGAVGAEPVGT